MMNPDVTNNVIDTTEAIEVNASSTTPKGSTVSPKATSDSESALMSAWGLTRSAIYLDRETSQIAFNWRVLAQAEDKSIPLLERLKYLCIVGSNLDEFFEVRVASLLAQNTIDGQLAQHAAFTSMMGRIDKECHALETRQYEVLNQDI